MTTHNKTNSPEYRAWRDMHSRCRNPNALNFSYYGGRGISVCEAWASFAQFYADMGEKPDPALTLGRINNDLGYSPENCRWETKSEQAYNRRKRGAAANAAESAAFWSQVAAVRPRRSRRSPLPDALIHEVRYRAIVLGHKHEAIGFDLGLHPATVTNIAAGRRRAGLAPDARLLEWLASQTPQPTPAPR